MTNSADLNKPTDLELQCLPRQGNIWVQQDQSKTQQQAVKGTPGQILGQLRLGVKMSKYKE